MLATSVRDCREAVATLVRDRTGSLFVAFSWSAELGYCYGCTQSEAASAQADDRFEIYPMFAPEFLAPAAADDGEGGSEAPLPCVDAPGWLSPDLESCAQLEASGACIAGLIADERATAGWRGGFPERSCCACGGGVGAGARALPPSPPPTGAGASASSAACHDRPSALRGGVDGNLWRAWTEPSGFGCADYAKQGWCARGTIARFAGPAHANPEVHCCVCGGGSVEADASLPAAAHLGCVHLAHGLDELPVALRASRIASLAVVSIGKVGGGGRKRSRATAELCGDRCVAFDYFAVGTAPRGAGAECVCYSLESARVPLTHVCDPDAELDDDSVHIYAHHRLAAPAGGKAGEEGAAPHEPLRAVRADARRKDQHPPGRRESSRALARGVAAGALAAAAVAVVAGLWASRRRRCAALARSCPPSPPPRQSRTHVLL
jgi:hypothetical protein